MDAGIELDAAVATDVFGWHVERFIWGGMEGDQEIPGEVWITDPARKDEPPAQRGDVTCNPILFSTSWEGMRLVVERMLDPEGPHASQKWSFGMEYSTVVDWVVDFTPRARHPKAREYPAFQAQATTAPHAICLAALAAVRAA